MDNLEQEKAKSFIALEIVDYIRKSVVMKNLLNKPTGNVTVVSFDSGEALRKNTSPFDTLIQVIDGIAEVVISNKSHFLDTGQSIIIPAHSPSLIRASVRVKMISTVIKSGYEDVRI